MKEVILHLKAIRCLLYIIFEYYLKILPDWLTSPHQYVLLDEEKQLCRCEVCGWYSWNGGNGWTHK
jgi:hypothetical protein